MHTLILCVPSAILSEFIRDNFLEDKGCHRVLQLDETLSPVVQTKALTSLFRSLMKTPKELHEEWSEKRKEKAGDEAVVWQAGRFSCPVVALCAGPGWGKSFTVDEIARKTDRVMEVARTVTQRSGSKSFSDMLERTTTIPITFNHLTNGIGSGETAAFSLVVRILFRLAVYLCGRVFLLSFT